MGLGSIGKAIAGAASGTFGIGTALGAADYLTGKSLQQDAQSFSAREADRARLFQERVLRNQIQWRASDLRKAGINPILAAGLGSSSPTAPGSTAQNAAMQQNSKSATNAASTMALLKTESEKQYMLRRQGDMFAQNKQESDARTQLAAVNALLQSLQVPQMTSLANFYSGGESHTATAFQEYGKGGTPGQIAGGLFGLGKLAQSAVGAAKTNKMLKKQLETLYRAVPGLKRIAPLFFKK